MTQQVLVLRNQRFAIMANNALLKLHLRVQDLRTRFQQLSIRCDQQDASKQQLQILNVLLLHKRLYFKFLEQQHDAVYSRADQAYFDQMQQIFTSLADDVSRLSEALGSVVVSAEQVAAEVQSGETTLPQEQSAAGGTSASTTEAGDQQRNIKRAIAKNHWAILRSHVQEGNHRHISFSQRLQASSEYINNIINDLEANLLQRATRRCENHYQAILRQHQNNVAWLDFLIEIYKEAYDKVDSTVTSIEEKAAARQKLFKDMAIGIISVALSPIGMDKLVGPLLTLASNVNFAEGVAAFMDSDAMETLTTVCDTAMEWHDDLAEPAQAPVPATAAAEVDPLKILQMTRMYCQHKAQGVLSDMHQLFNPAMANNPILGDVGPRQLIRDLIKLKIREIKAGLTRVNWELYCENEFRRFREKLLVDAEQELIKLIDECFGMLGKQYEATGDNAQCAKLLEKITFDDNATSHNAVNMKQRDDLKAELLKYIETTMLLVVAKDSRTYFGKIKEMGCCRVSDESYYAQYPSFKSLEFIKAILARHHALFPKDADSRRLLEREPGKLLLNKLGHDPFETQRERQDILDRLMETYAPTALEANMKKAILGFAASFGIRADNTAATAAAETGSAGTSQKATAQPAGWMPEAKLEQACQGVFSNLVNYSQKHQLLSGQEFGVLRDIAALEKLRRNILIKQPTVQRRRSLAKI